MLLRNSNSLYWPDISILSANVSRSQTFVSSHQQGHRHDWKNGNNHRKQDPYVVCIVGQEKHSTDKSKGTNPTWTETLRFNAGSDKLEIEVWDKDRFSSDDLVGKATVSLVQMYNHQLPKQNGTIRFKVVEVDLEQKGEIMGKLRL